MEPLIIKRQTKHLYRKLAFSPVTLFAIYSTYQKGMAGQTWRWAFFCVFVIFFISTVIYLVKNTSRVLKKIPALIIDDNGITNYLVDPDGDKVSWKQISHGEIKKIRNINRLLVYLDEPEKFMSAYQGYSLGEMKNMMKKAGTPWFVNTDLIEGDPYDIVNTIEEMTGTKIELA
ncbi:MAG: STM3941 family protein [Bacteroidia bacterium]